MTQCMDAAWAAERQHVLDAVLAPAWGPSAQRTSHPPRMPTPTLASPYRPSPTMLQSPLGAPSCPMGSLLKAAAASVSCRPCGLQLMQRRTAAACARAHALRCDRQRAAASPLRVART